MNTGGKRLLIISFLSVDYSMHSYINYMRRLFCGTSLLHYCLLNVVIIMVVFLCSVNVFRDLVKEVSSEFV